MVKMKIFSERLAHKSRHEAAVNKFLVNLKDIINIDNMITDVGQYHMGYVITIITYKE